ncbi:hypothetical protein [Chakrabartyella piscis]|uniref:hypothetical protein n=1 Tax=Chakrabartyella piscis TaxID=2918914 RepID=UPI0029585EA1|nr:hypothetical protein [Chakrabartyella piscis]
MITTIKEFLFDLATIAYDNGDYRMVQNAFRDKEINGFVEIFLAGTEIVMDGKEGKPLILKGIANDDKGTTGAEEIELCGYQLFDYSDTDGNWYVISFLNKEKVEEYLLSEAGYLNFYSTQMFVFLDGKVQYFEIMFDGDGGTTIPIDKDQIDMPLDISAMAGRIWVRWIAPEELAPLTDEDVAAFLKSLQEKETE